MQLSCAVETIFSRPESCLRGSATRAMVRIVSTITAILDPDVDGTLHLPLPAEMRSSKVKVTATLESVGQRPSPTEVRQALEALARMGTFSDIKDPAVWQREIRDERRAGSNS